PFRPLSPDGLQAPPQLRSFGADPIGRLPKGVQVGGVQVELLQGAPDLRLAALDRRARTAECRLEERHQAGVDAGVLLGVAQCGASSTNGRTHTVCEASVSPAPRFAETSC